MDANVVAHETINDDYEYIQYNEQLRIIRSVKDDMYQMKSIITACHSNKLPKDWFKNESTQELLEELGRGEFSQTFKPYENRENLSNTLKGMYINKLLVNHVAMWASSKYSIYIFKLLDNIATEYRNKLEHKISEDKERLVPITKSKSYNYMIWKENIDDDVTKTKLHLVKRNKKTFRGTNNQISKDETKCWFFRKDLPISMTINEDIKQMIKQNFGNKDYKINSSTIIIKTDLLNELHKLITEYVNKFQQ